MFVFALSPLTLVPPIWPAWPSEVQRNVAMIVLHTVVFAGWPV